MATLGLGAAGASWLAAGPLHDPLGGALALAGTILGLSSAQPTATAYSYILDARRTLGSFRRAKRTELLLGVILGTMLLRLAMLANRWHVAPPTGQTVLSQIMAMAVGRNGAYYLMSLTIMIVLALAANTSFGGLSVLASFLAKNNYLPHLYALRDDRQVFASGIWALAVRGTML